MDNNVVEVMTADRLRTCTVVGVQDAEYATIFDKEWCARCFVRDLGKILPFDVDGFLRIVQLEKDRWVVAMSDYFLVIQTPEVQ